MVEIFGFSIPMQAIWIAVAIGAVAVIAAVVIVLVVKNRREKARKRQRIYDPTAPFGPY